VDSESYENVATSLTEEMNFRKLPSDVYIVKYDSPILSHVQAESRVKEIVEEDPTIPCLLVGHSQGGYLAVDVAKKYNLPLVQWAGGFYDKSIYEFSQPLMTLLCEYDDCFPITKMVDKIHTEYPQNTTSPTRIMTSVPLSTHMYGISDPKEARIVSKRIASFLEYACSKSESSRVELCQMMDRIGQRYSKFIYEKHVGANSELVVQRQSQLWPGKKFYDTHHSLNSNIYTTLISVTFPWASIPIDFYWIFPNFVVSHPTDQIIHSYSPTRHYGNFGTLLFRKLMEPPLWVKLKHDGNLTTAKRMNEATFQEAYVSLSEEEKAEYDKNGKKMIFGDDIIIPKFTGGLGWVLMPLITLRNGDGNLVIRSPVLRTETGDGLYDGRFNAKILSKAQALEWLLQNAFQK
jgi:hypothetical protein